MQPFQARGVASHNMDGSALEVPTAYVEGKPVTVARNLRRDIIARGRGWGEAFSQNSVRRGEGSCHCRESMHARARRSKGPNSLLETKGHPSKINNKFAGRRIRYDESAALRKGEETARLSVGVISCRSREASLQSQTTFWYELESTTKKCCCGNKILMSIQNGDARRVTPVGEESRTGSKPTTTCILGSLVIIAHHDKVDHG